MTDAQALALYVHELHFRLGTLLIRDLNDATDMYYRPHEGGLLEQYLRTVDEMGERFGIPEDQGDERRRFYPPRAAEST